jgi:cytochrome c-type biogenesis protein CcmH/NrfG
MQRAVPWIAAVLLLGCLALGILVLRQRSEIAGAISARSTDEKMAQSRISELQRQVGELKKAQVEAARQIAQFAQGATASKNPQGDGANGGVRTVHISDLLKEHPEYAVFYEKQMRRVVDRM